MGQDSKKSHFFFHRYTTPAVCRYVATQLDICSLGEQSIYFSLRSKFDMLPVATSIDSAFFLHAPQGISSALAPYRAEGYIERRVSGAYRRRICVSKTRRIRHGSRLQKKSFLFSSIHNTSGVSICCFATRYLLAGRAIDIFLTAFEIRYVACGNEYR